MKPFILEKKRQTNPGLLQLCWVNNPAVKNLLDVISSILAEEYIEIAKKNHDVFSNEK